MLISEIRPSTVAGVKRLASQLKKQHGIKHSDALDQASRAAGKANFRHALRSLQGTGNRPEFHYVLLTIYWSDKDRRHQCGRETLKIDLSKPIPEICSKHSLKYVRGFGNLRMVAEDHFVCDSISPSQEYAPLVPMNQEQEPNQIALTSPDGREARLAELRRLFPDLFDGEGVLDEKALRQLISEEVGHITERFRFEWAGKAQSKRFAFAPSKATLVYDPARSVNADGTPSKAGETLQDNTSRNLIIEGDNLEALKLLFASYQESVKCIYATLSAPCRRRSARREANAIP